MKRVYVLLAVLALLVPLAVAQAPEHLNASDSVSASIGRGRAITEHERIVGNDVSLSFHHCQKYMSTVRPNVLARLFGAKARIVVNTDACMADPSTLFRSEIVHNLRTNAGGDWQAAQMAGTPGAACTYLGFASDSSNAGAGTVTATDTAINSSGTGSTEITTNGFYNGAARWQGTYAHTAGTSAYTLTKLITATGTQSTNKIGIFTTTTAGTMCFEALFTPASLISGDTLNINPYTVNF